MLRTSTVSKKWGNWTYYQDAWTHHSVLQWEMTEKWETARSSGEVFGLSQLPDSSQEVFGRLPISVGQNGARDLYSDLMI